MSLVTMFLPLFTLLLSFCFASPPGGRSINSAYAVSHHSIQLKLITNSGRGSSKLLHQNVAQSTSQSNTSSSLIDLGLEFAAPVMISDQYFYLILDTGSADTWVAGEYFICLYGTIGPYSSLMSQEYCAFGSTVDESDPDFYFNLTPDVNFYTPYNDGSAAAGALGTTSLQLTTDVNVPSQQIGIATIASWTGDNTTSGVLGLAYSSLTSMYPGTDILADVKCPTFSNASSTSADNKTCDRETYPALIETLFQTSNRSYDFDDNIFSIALSRDASESYDGGLLTFGGIPDPSLPSVNVSSSFVVTPIEPVNTDPSEQLSFYCLSLDGFMMPSTGGPLTNYTALSGTKSSRVRRNEYLEHAKSRRSATNVMHPATNDVQISQYVVDSGTTLSYIPPPMSYAFNMLFSPPAYRDYANADGLWTVDCNSTINIPDFGVVISGEVLYHNPDDLILQLPSQRYNPMTGEYDQTSICISAIQDYYQPRTGVAGILGQPFLKNVLAVFDIGRSQLGFAPRMYYES